MAKPIITKAGYFKPSELFYRLFTVFLSIVLLVLASPAFLIIAVIIKLQDNGPVFYKGVRLGRNKHPFMMYKFRTMVPDAEQVIGAELFSRSLESGTAILTRTGRFLRETRLDELPQLINTLKGDMDLLGPRPLRPAVYEKFCAGIRGFDRRFAVRPGLFGFSQLFTPHSSPKRIRNLIDNRFLQIPNRYTVELVLLFYALAVLSGRLVVSLATSSYAALSERSRGKKDQRRYARKGPRNITVRIRSAGESEAAVLPEAALKDINEEALCIYTNEAITAEKVDITLVITLRKRRPSGPARKRAYCYGTVFREHPSDHKTFKHCYVLKYTPVTPFNSYIVHQYFLEESIV